MANSASLLDHGIERKESESNPVFLLLDTWLFIQTWQICKREGKTA